MAPSFFSSALLLAATAVAAPVTERAPHVSHVSHASHAQTAAGAFSVQDAGSFTQHSVYDFSQASAIPDGLFISTDSIGSDGDTLSQQYTKDNVFVQDGVLNMKVPGGQTEAPIRGAQLVTTERGILYGSIRTIAKVSDVGGTCSGFFSYNNDNFEETDIEILTGNLTAIHYTNQNPHAAQGGPRSATTEGPIPDDAAQTFHEYRTDWLPGKVRFYLDGEFQTEITEYTPTAGTPWVWNNWSNGDESWSAGPPNADNILQIQKIEMYYNTTAS